MTASLQQLTASITNPSFPTWYYAHLHPSCASSHRQHNSLVLPTSEQPGSNVFEQNGLYCNFTMIYGHQLFLTHPETFPQVGFEPTTSLDHCGSNRDHSTRANYTGQNLSRTFMLIRSNRFQPLSPLHSDNSNTIDSSWISAQAEQSECRSQVLTLINCIFISF